MLTWFPRSSRVLLRARASPEIPHGEPEHQRQGRRDRCRTGNAPALGASRPPADDRHQVRLRRGALWRMHRARGRSAGALVRDADLRGGGQESDDDRGPAGQPRGRGGASLVGQDPGAPVRLLSIGTGDGRHGAPHEDAESDRCADRGGHERQHLPLRDLWPGAHRDQGSREEAGRCRMNAISRREFLKASAAAGGGLLIGFRFGDAKAQGASSLKPNAWVEIKADGSIILTCHRTERGQAVTTSVAMLLAEELEVDPRSVKVVQAGVDPVYINKLLGGQITGGSTSIRAGGDTLRQAGAGARVMLASAAAAKWNVPVADVRAENGYIVSG